MNTGDFTQFLTALGAFESGIDTSHPQSASYLQALKVFDPQFGNVNASTVNINNSQDLANLQYHVFNTLGFMGKYQFGEPLLIDLGYYVPASTGYYGTTATNEWKGAWTGKNDVHSKADFMSTVQEMAIREAFAMNMDIINQYLAQAGKTVDDYLGHQFTYTRLGEAHVATVTVSGILASAHLQGPGGVAQLLLHNVASNDEYGTNILFYMDKYASYGTPFGTSGDDFLVGSAYGETFAGGAGHNTYQTGGGEDKIIIAKNMGGSDTIQDFDIHNAVISLAQFPGTKFSDLSVTEINGHALITLPGAQTISLLNVHAADITAKQFVYGPYALSWSANSGNHIISDFNPKYDVIDLNYAFSSSNLKLYEVNGSTVLEVVGNNQEITLQGISLSQLSEANFIKAPVDFATVAFGIGADHTPPVTPAQPPVVIPPDLGQTTHTTTTGGNQQGTSGNDVFSYTWNWGSKSVISNFNPSADKIDLHNFWTSFDEISIHNDSNGNAVIDLTDINNQTITLTGVSANNLATTNFIGVDGTFHPTGTVPTTPVVPPVTPVTPVTPHVVPIDNSGAQDSNGHTYSYTWNWGGKDVVQSFDVNKDTLDLKTFWTSYDKMSIHNDAHGNAVIDLTGINNQTITLNGVSSANLSAKNIVGVTGTFSQSADAGSTHEQSTSTTNSSTPQSGATLPVVNHAMTDSTLTGSDNAKDVYSFTWSWGSNKTITNFNPNQDVVDLKQFWTTPDKVSIHNDAHGNAVIDLTALNNQTITLTGVSADHLHTDANVLL